MQVGRGVSLFEGGGGLGLRIPGAGGLRLGHSGMSGATTS